MVLYSTLYHVRAQVWVIGFTVTLNLQVFLSIGRFTFLFVGYSQDIGSWDWDTGSLIVQGCYISKPLSMMLLSVCNIYAKCNVVTLLEAAILQETFLSRALVFSVFKEVHQEWMLLKVSPWSLRPSDLCFCLHFWFCINKLRNSWGAFQHKSWVHCGMTHPN